MHEIVSHCCVILIQRLVEIQVNNNSLKIYQWALFPMSHKKNVLTWIAYSIYHGWIWEEVGEYSMQIMVYFIGSIQEFTAEEG